jgi:hypothetical protein
VPDAPYTNYEHGTDCDGSLSFDKGLREPVIAFGPNCQGQTTATTTATTTSSDPGVELGDAAFVAIARAANASDPELKHWLKSEKNPIVFAKGSPPCSFAGKIFKAHGVFNLLCAGPAGGAWARYTTTDLTLHGPWSLADKNFAHHNGTGATIGQESGPSFLPLPPGGSGSPTHIISDGAYQSYSFGNYDEQTMHFNILGTFSVGGAMSWTAAGLAGDRVLVAGWIETNDRANPRGPDPRCPKIDGIEICSIQMLSLVREMMWETWDTSHGTVVVNPLPEYRLLRNRTLYTAAQQRVERQQPHALPLPPKTGAAIDINLTVALPSNQSSTITFGVTVFAGLTVAAAAQNTDGVQHDLNSNSTGWHGPIEYEYYTAPNPCTGSPNLGCLPNVNNPALCESLCDQKKGCDTFNYQGGGCCFMKCAGNPGWPVSKNQTGKGCCSYYRIGHPEPCNAVKTQGQCQPPRCQWVGGECKLPPPTPPPPPPPKPCYLYKNQTGCLSARCTHRPPTGSCCIWNGGICELPPPPPPPACGLITHQSACAGRCVWDVAAKPVGRCTYTPGQRLMVTVGVPDISGLRLATFGIINNPEDESQWRQTMSDTAADFEMLVGACEPPYGYVSGCYPILPSETTLDIRVLVDRSVAEFFVAKGRWNAVERSFPDAGSGGVIVDAVSGFDDEALVLETVEVYEMGCGWVEE